MFWFFESYRIVDKSLSDLQGKNFVCEYMFLLFRRLRAKVKYCNLVEEGKFVDIKIRFFGYVFVCSQHVIRVCVVCVFVIVFWDQRQKSFDFFRVCK